MRLDWAPYRVHQRETFRVSRESYDYQDCQIVRLRSNDCEGYGEATAFSVYGATLEGISEALASCRTRVERLRLTHPVDLWDELGPCLETQPFARCAVDVAAYDLWGKTQQRAIYSLLGTDLDQLPPSDFTLGLAPLERTLEVLEERAGWPVFKVKLGGGDDENRLRRIRERTDAILRVDANGGWNVDQTLRMAELLEELSVECLEQPLPADDWDGMEALYGKLPLPVIADESCTVEASLDRCLELFDGVNLKLMKCGGITPALRSIESARQSDKLVHMGCMPETSIGIAALAHLAPLLDGVDADSIELIGNDIADGIRLDRGRLTLSGGPGLGVEIDRSFDFEAEL